MFSDESLWEKRIVRVSDAIFRIFDDRDVHRCTELDFNAMTYAEKYQSAQEPPESWRSFVRPLRVDGDEFFVFVTQNTIANWLTSVRRRLAELEQVPISIREFVADEYRRAQEKVEMLKQQQPGWIPVEPELAKYVRHAYERFRGSPNTGGSTT
jgi:hypothetical protein